MAAEESHEQILDSWDGFFLFSFTTTTTGIQNGGFMKTIRCVLWTALWCALSVTVMAQPHAHELKFIPGNVHLGHYDSAMKPVLRIESGDTVRAETCGLPPFPLGCLMEADIPQVWRDVDRSITDRGPGPHTLTGPIYINGAEH